MIKPLSLLTTSQICVLILPDLNQDLSKIRITHMPSSPNFLASGASGGFLQQSPNYLQSANGLFNALMLPNGTFAVFRGPGPGPGPMGSSALLWATGNLSGPLGQYYLDMQADGNLVVYKGVPTPNNNTNH